VRTRRLMTVTRLSIPHLKVSIFKKYSNTFSLFFFLLIQHIG
jgi:hypothetical protein